MTLRLVMIRCPDDAAPERREVSGVEFSIGRGPGNDWIIDDPKRVISKRHCALMFRAGSWELSDLSSNGTFLNHASVPIGAGSVRTLRNSDRISFGAYELEVAIDATEPSGGHAPVASYAPRAAELLDPFADLPAFGGRDGAVVPEDGHVPDTPGVVCLPADFDPLAHDEGSLLGPTQPDHAPAIDSAFRPPSAPPVLIPEDWDVDLPVTRQTPATAPQTFPPAGEASVPEPSLPETTRPSRVSVPSPPDATLVAAFLHGAGLDGVALADPQETLERIGASLRAVVSGIRQVLIARSTIKDEFRIEQTMIRASGNNPLKFSTDDDDALAALLGLRPRSVVEPVDAITEALQDMRLHELATVSAMQVAVRALLARFDPAAIERRAENSALDILPAQQKARAWKAFEQLHKKVTQALSDDFDSVFGKAFARAYEGAIAELSTRRTPS